MQAPKLSDPRKDFLTLPESFTPSPKLDPRDFHLSDKFRPAVGYIASEGLHKHWRGSNTEELLVISIQSFQQTVG